MSSDKRRFQGAVAGAIMSDSVRRRIQKSGFYAIEQTGDTVMINVPEGFTPWQWNYLSKTTMEAGQKVIQILN